MALKTLRNILVATLIGLPVIFSSCAKEKTSYNTETTSQFSNIQVTTGSESSEKQLVLEEIVSETKKQTFHEELTSDEIKNIKDKYGSSGYGIIDTIKDDNLAVYCEDKGCYYNIENQEVVWYYPLKGNDNNLYLSEVSRQLIYDTKVIISDDERKLISIQSIVDYPNKTDVFLSEETSEPGEYHLSLCYEKKYDFEMDSTSGRLVRFNTPESPATLNIKNGRITTSDFRTVGNMSKSEMEQFSMLKYLLNEDFARDM